MVDESLNAVRVFELIPDTEYFVFLADRDDQLPGQEVERELRMAVNLGRNAEERRGVVDTLLADVVAGIVGGTSWGAIAMMLGATTSYLRDRKQLPPVTDAAVVVARVRSACDQIMPDAAPAIEFTDVRQLANGCWTASFTQRGVAVKVVLDPACSIISWERTTSPPPG
jgi:hypothetical protein